MPDAVDIDGVSGLQERLGQFGVGFGGEQGDPITGVGLANLAKGGERLNEIAQSSQLDDQHAHPTPFRPSPLLYDPTRARDRQNSAKAL